MTTRTIIAFIVLAGAPLIPLIATWKRFVFQSGEEVPVCGARGRVETIIITASFLLLLGGLVWSPVFGSRLRQAALNDHLYKSRRHGVCVSRVCFWTEAE